MSSKDSLNNEEYSQYKHVVLLGNNAVGKTALLEYLRGKPNSSTKNTIGISREEEINDICGVKLLDFIWNTDQIKEISHRISSSNIKVAIFVASAQDDDINTSIMHWNSQLRQYAKDPFNIKKLLVITKTDLGLVKFEQEKLVKDFNISKVFKTSILDGTGFQDLRESIKELVSFEPKELSPVELIVKTMVLKLCELVAESPEHLMNIEWRELEKLIAFSLEHLGFDITLTPSSKDGGKDVIAKCKVSNSLETYFIEIKHWKSGGKRAGNIPIREFIEVNATNGTNGGLFLSSSGFTTKVHSQIGELLNHKIRLGDSSKIVALCQRYVQSKQGVWQSDTPLPELLFEKTITE